MMNDFLSLNFIVIKRSFLYAPRDLLCSGPLWTGSSVWCFLKEHRVFIFVLCYGASVFLTSTCEKFVGVVQVVLRPFKYPVENFVLPEQIILNFLEELDN